jgi:hypothetical protein
MELTDFFRRRGVYEQRARDRTSEYLNTASADCTYQERVITEMCIDLISRMEKVEELLKPAPDPKPEPKDKPKFF